MRGVVYRIKSSDFSVYEIRGKSCEKCKNKFPEAVAVVKLFDNHGNLKMIIDKKEPKFLKGGFSQGKVVGARIDVLPDGRKLNKAYCPEGITENNGILAFCKHVIMILKD